MRERVKTITTANPEHELIIDEYFSNGFNMTNAVLKYKPEWETSTAKVHGSVILRSKKNREYIQVKQNELREQAKVSPAELANELKVIAFSDVTNFIGLEEEEVKSLAPDLRRQLKKITIKTKEYRYKDGSQATETTRQYELHDKLKAIELLGKHIGFFEEDNRQKGVNVNILQVLKDQHPETLKTLLSAIESANTGTA